MSETHPIDQSESQLVEQDNLPGYERAQQSVQNLLRYVDIAAAVLLAIATVSTAWCAYQATRWSGVQATSFAEASTARIESTRQFNLALQTLNLDAGLFTDWVNAYANDNTELRQFYESNLIRPDFMPYLNEWVASEPLQNPNALRNPLSNETYQKDLLAESERLRSEAESKFQKATDANQTGDDYILATVMFASVLFFAGISNKFERVRIQGALVAIAAIMLILGVFQIGSLPVH